MFTCDPSWIFVKIGQEVPEKRDEKTSNILFHRQIYWDFSYSGLFKNMRKSTIDHFGRETSRHVDRLHMSKYLISSLA